MARANITKEKRVKIAQKLTVYVTSPQFKNPIEEIIHVSSDLQNMIKIEAKQHFAIWKKRWERYQKITWDTTQIQSNLQLVLHDKEPKPILNPKIQPLQLPLVVEKKP